MKSITCLLMSFIAAFAPLAAREHHVSSRCSPNIELHDGCRLSLNHGSIIFTDRWEDGEVEITEENGLIVNGRTVDLDPVQQDLVREYRSQVESVWHDAKKIGMEGAKVGVEGAKLGITAAVNVVRLIAPGYDEDDFDRDMEEAEDRLEARADALEKRADKLEKQVDTLKDLHERLKEAVPELERLEWF
ncbi:MAG TPA: hypothetical protein VGB38_00075 [bacterium]